MLKKIFYAASLLFSFSYLSSKLRRKYALDEPIFSDKPITDSFKFDSRDDLEKHLFDNDKKEIHIHHQCENGCFLCNEDDLNSQSFKLNGSEFKHYRVSMNNKIHHFIKKA